MARLRSYSLTSLRPGIPLCSTHSFRSLQLLGHSKTKIHFSSGEGIRLIAPLGRLITGERTALALALIGQGRWIKINAASRARPITTSLAVPKTTIQSLLG